MHATQPIRARAHAPTTRVAARASACRVAPRGVRMAQPLTTRSSLWTMTASVLPLPSTASRNEPFFPAARRGVERTEPRKATADLVTVRADEHDRVADAEFPAHSRARRRATHSLCRIAPRPPPPASSTMVPWGRSVNRNPALPCSERRAERRKEGAERRRPPGCRRALRVGPRRQSRPQRPRGSLCAPRRSCSECPRSRRAPGCFRRARCCRLRPSRRCARRPGRAPLHVREQDQQLGPDERRDMAASWSLSPKCSSSTETVSFSLTIGSAPTSSSSLSASRALFIRSRSARSE